MLKFLKQLFCKHLNRINKRRGFCYTQKGGIREISGAEGTLEDCLDCGQELFTPDKKVIRC